MIRSVSDGWGCALDRILDVPMSTPCGGRQLERLTVIVRVTMVSSWKRL